MPHLARRSERRVSALRHPRLKVRLAAAQRDAIDVGDATNALRALAWRDLGIERSRFGLEEAVHMMQFWSRYVMDKEFHDRTGWELQNMLLTARLIAAAALVREESRGVHCRTDFPDLDDAHWKVRIVMRKGEDARFLPV